ncbi:MAG TPA: glycosyl hydrolase family 18 protein [Solirubrobacteraceae bacterium]|nr:glycosyl hydrolase family 18 protein [Solirubrobacteraceae bacterium]
MTLGPIDRHPRPLRTIGRLALAAALVLLCTPLSGAALAAKAAPRAAPARSVQAYLLSSAPDSLRDLRAHARSIDVLYPTFFDCSVPGGQVTGTADAAVTAYARARQIVVMPRFNCQDRATVHAILTRPALRAATLARLIAIAREGPYGGLNLDLENDGPRDRQALTSFATALAARLHAIHQKLSVVVDGVSHDDPGRSTGFYDDRALAVAADTVFVLAWGAHWEGSGPGAIAPLGAASETAAYLASLPNARRFVLGAPMYGLDWPEGGGGAYPAKALQYSGIVALAHARHARVRSDPASYELTFQYTDGEGVLHRVWSMDAEAVAALLRIARAHGLSAGLWRLGEEDQSLWSSSLLTH